MKGQPYLSTYLPTYLSSCMSVDYVTGNSGTPAPSGSNKPIDHM